MNYINIKNKTKLDFKSNDEPYLIKNYAKDWYAFKNWSFEFIKNLDPNLMVNAIIGGNMYTSGEKKFVNIKLEDYIKSIISGDSEAYLSTFHLFSKFPSLKKHIDYKEIKKNSLICNLLAWIGPKESITGFHADWADNFNIQIRGKKQFYLVSPKYNKNMYPSEKYERFAIGSLIDLKNFDKDKFPLFEQSELIKVTLDEGDCLYLPRGWWHYTESLEPSINVSMHYWKLNGIFKDVITGLTKMFLHNIGLYKKHSCACHTFNEKGQRLLRS
jgi:hypothetical protein